MTERATHRLHTLLAFSAVALAPACLCAQSVSDAQHQPDSAFAMPLPFDRGAAGLAQSLRKLSTRASFLQINAHPDDEDGATLAYESRGVGAEVSLLSLNRGEGGQNVMTSDFWDSLGILRTQEHLAANRYYGVHLYYTRVADFGFSKTREETLKQWGHERVLGDAVRVVRETRPMVITSVFAGNVSDGHGHHQTAGWACESRGSFVRVGRTKEPRDERSGSIPIARFLCPHIQDKGTTTFGGGDLRWRTRPAWLRFAADRATNLNQKLLFSTVARLTPPWCGQSRERFETGGPAHLPAPWVRRPARGQAANPALSQPSV